MFHQKNLSDFDPTLNHDFNLQQKQSLRFKFISFNHGTKRFQEENHGRHDNHILYRRRSRTHGNGSDIPLERWERIFNFQHNSKSPA